MCSQTVSTKYKKSPLNKACFPLMVITTRLLLFGSGSSFGLQNIISVNREHAHLLIYWRGVLRGKVESRTFKNPSFTPPYTNPNEAAEILKTCKVPSCKRFELDTREEWAAYGINTRHTCARELVPEYGFIPAQCTSSKSRFEGKRDRAKRYDQHDQFSKCCKHEYRARLGFNV